MTRALLIAALLVLGAGASDVPKVRLSSPLGGWTSQRMVTIAGTVSDRRLSTVQVGMNGAAHTVNVHGGHFEARLPVRPGQNAVEVVAQGPSGSSRERTSVYARTGRTDVQILLSWDSNGTDLDLHVTDPAGEECYYGHRRTVSGAVLEVDDTDGFGPEVLLVPVAPLGEYRVSVAYYDAGRAPETEARVEVVVRGGTADERRYTFPVTLTHEGETVEVGSFFVDRAP